jgi:ribosomal protein S18 acetylase RimI-like enzyme
MARIAIEPPDESVMRTIGEGLRAHNIRAGGAPLRPEDFVVALRDDKNVLIGGITCDLYLGGLLIEWVWVDGPHRGVGHGRRLLEAAEAEGRKRGASFAHLDTFTFQAQGFYERCGYRVFGTLDYPDGLRRFYMRKALD